MNLYTIIHQMKEELMWLCYTIKLHKDGGGAEADAGRRSLNGNQIGDAGAAAIGKALKTNAALSELRYGKRARPWGTRSRVWQRRAG